MRVLWTRWQIPLDLELEWTSIELVRQELQRAADEFDRLCDRGDEMHTWSVPFFQFWRGGHFEVGGRLHSPTAELLPVAYPLSEKWARYCLIIDSRLLHPASGHLFFDLHARLKYPDAASLDPTASTEPATPASSRQEPSGLSTTERRDDLVFETWQTYGFPPYWTRQVAFAATRERYQGNALLNVRDTAERESWTRVQLRARNPPR